MIKWRVWMAVSLLAYSCVAFAAPANRKLAEIRSQLAVEYASLGNLPVALESANEAVEADGSFVGAYLTRGYIFNLMHLDADAEKNFLKALQVDPPVRKPITTTASSCASMIARDRQWTIWPRQSAIRCTRHHKRPI
jgi:Tfp pilus assembly protein PilF